MKFAGDELTGPPQEDMGSKQFKDTDSDSCWSVNVIASWIISSLLCRSERLDRSPNAAAAAGSGW